MRKRMNLDITKELVFRRIEKLCYVYYNRQNENPVFILLF